MDWAFIENRKERNTETSKIWKKKERRRRKKYHAAKYNVIQKKRFLVLTGKVILL